MKVPVFLDQGTLEAPQPPSDPVVAYTRLLRSMSLPELETELAIVGEHITHHRLMAATLRQERHAMQARHRKELEDLDRRAGEVATSAANLDKLRRRLYTLRDYSRAYKKEKP